MSDAPERPINCPHTWVHKRGDAWVCGGPGCDALFRLDTEKVPTWECCEHGTPRGLGCWMCENYALNVCRAQLAAAERRAEEAEAFPPRGILLMKLAQLGWLTPAEADELRADLAEARDIGRLMDEREDLLRAEMESWKGHANSYIELNREANARAQRAEMLHAQARQEADVAVAAARELAQRAREEALEEVATIASRFNLNAPLLNQRVTAGEIVGAIRALAKPAPEKPTKECCGSTDAGHERGCAGVAPEKPEWTTKSPPPRYDDVYVKGAAWLDGMTSEPTDTPESPQAMLEAAVLKSTMRRDWTREPTDTAKCECDKDAVMTGIPDDACPTHGARTQTEEGQE